MTQPIQSDSVPSSPSVAAVPLIDLVAQHQTIADEVQEAVARVFAAQSFVLGDEVAEFEYEIAEYCDARDAIGCASGTDALILALMAHDIGPGDEVITSPFTFFATASSICRVGAKPVFVDIDPVSFNLIPEQVEEAITSRTRAIMPVHLFGQCAEMEPLWRMAVQHGLVVIEDACQAIGAEYRGRRAGVLGTTGCFSFFPTKNLGGAGDGGIITTDDPEIASRLRRLRVHGDTGGYRHVEVGLNSRLDALQAAVLRVKLRHLDDWTAGRQKNAGRYAQLFETYDIDDTLQLPQVLGERRHVFNQFVVRVKSDRRNEVLASLRERQIGAAVYYPSPLHLQKCFAFLGYGAGDFPHAELACEEVLALPIFTELREDQQDRVVEGLVEILELSERQSVRLKQTRAA
ncbi:MAG: DegT/DnrJ/EryC1/StrS family aminotransferase [Planctomycetota bacterium]|nr:DegT/DnrJ/EryC1/StrS family aminotransferase [Planctomycetota bacterium]MDA1212794.1 DegT/DnrJ/EryC1/StrS family aminotransferase [Planctomycetota bacterium]